MYLRLTTKDLSSNILKERVKNKKVESQIGMSDYSLNLYYSPNRWKNPKARSITKPSNSKMV